MISSAKLYSNVIKNQNRPDLVFSSAQMNNYSVPSQPKLFHQLIKIEENAVYRERREMIEDLPVRITNDILEGRRSPVLPIMVIDQEGNEVKSRSRFKLIRKEDGDVDALFYPEIEKADLRLFSEQSRTLLEQGKVIVGTIPDKNGNMVRSFVQIDNETNQVLSAPVQVIARNLQFISEDIHLSEAEFNNLQNGEPVTFVRDDDDEPITVGIDLNNRTGVRVSSGDAKMWSEQRTRDWDKFTFGIYGCWVMGEDGNLDYVKEEDYTDELWNEQKKAGLRSMGHMR